MTETCAPPPEHAHHRLHWLLRGADEWACEVWDQCRRRWAEGSPQYMHAAGWRYVAPAIPPQEGA